MIIYINKHDAVFVVQSVPRICVYFDVLLEVHVISDTRCTKTVAIETQPVHLLDAGNMAILRSNRMG